MHPLFERANELSHSVIGAAIEVHRLKGPGLIESIYEKCFMRELSLRGMDSVNQQEVTIEYKGVTFEEPLRFDVLVEGCLLVELKCIEKVLAIHKAQLLSYMRLLDVPVWAGGTTTRWEIPGSNTNGRGHTCLKHWRFMGDQNLLRARCRIGRASTSLR